MAGMEGLGRVCNLISAGSGKAFNMDECSGVTLLVSATGASSVAVTAAKTFAGSYVNFTPANGFTQTDHWYQSTASDGTAGWTKQTASWSTATLTLAGTSGYQSVVEIFGSQMADQYKYLKFTVTNGSCIIVTHDLTVQRKPANLKILGA